MDPHPERKPFLDKWVCFMNARKIPIGQFQTNLKRIVDVFSLYTLVNDRGGFINVCQVRNKSK